MNGGYGLGLPWPYPLKTVPCGPGNMPLARQTRRSPPMGGQPSSSAKVVPGEAGKNGGGGAPKSTDGPRRPLHAGCVVRRTKAADSPRRVPPPLTRNRCSRRPALPSRPAGRGGPPPNRTRRRSCLSRPFRVPLARPRPPNAPPWSQGTAGSALRAVRPPAGEGCVCRCCAAPRRRLS